MTRHRVSELTGALLDAAVAKALDWTFEFEDNDCPIFGPSVERPLTLGLHQPYGNVPWAPSTCWSQGGLIIERSGVSLMTVTTILNGERCECWEASVWGGKAHTGYVPEQFYDKRPLIAICRAKVASHFGEFVELP